MITVRIAEGKLPYPIKLEFLKDGQPISIAACDVNLNIISKLTGERSSQGKTWLTVRDGYATYIVGPYYELEPNGKKVYFRHIIYLDLYGSPDPEITGKFSIELELDASLYDQKEEVQE